MRIFIDGQGHEVEDEPLDVTAVLMMAGVAPKYFDLVFLGQGGITVHQNGEKFMCCPGDHFVTARISAGTA